MTGFTLSSAFPADYEAFAALFPELAVPDPIPSRERFAEGIAPDAIFIRDGSVVAGYAWARPRADRLHVVNVITAPAYRRRGVAHALMDAVAARGRAAGLARWMLNVKPENVAARALYERCGMHVVFASVLMHLPWAHVARMPSAAGASACDLALADDARFEDALSLTRGEITSFRAPGRVVVGVEDPAGPAGFAAFDPAFPGASAFRVRAPAHARPLLDALRPYALREHDHLLLLVEGNPDLEAMLHATGAHAVMRTLRMEGDIPA